MFLLAAVLLVVSSSAPEPVAAHSQRETLAPTQLPIHTLFEYESWSPLKTNRKLRSGPVRPEFGVQHRRWRPRDVQVRRWFRRLVVVSLRREKFVSRVHLQHGLPELRGLRQRSLPRLVLRGLRLASDLLDLESLPGVHLPTGFCGWSVCHVPVDWFWRRWAIMKDAHENRGVYNMFNVPWCSRCNEFELVLVGSQYGRRTFDFYHWFSSYPSCFR